MCTFVSMFSICMLNVERKTKSHFFILQLCNLEPISDFIITKDCFFSLFYCAFPSCAWVSAHMLDNEHVTALALKYLNQQFSQTPIHHCSLIQSGPVSQSEQGLVTAPG